MKIMMEYKGYKAEIYYSVKDEIFAGEVVNAKPPIHFMCKTGNEIRDTFHRCVNEHEIKINSR